MVRAFQIIVWIWSSLSLDFQDIPKNKSSMSDHPPLQQYSEHSANVAFVLNDGVESGVGAMMVICVLAVIPPMTVTLSLLSKVKETDHH